MTLPYAFLLHGRHDLRLATPPCYHGFPETVIYLPRHTANGHDRRRHQLTSHNLLPQRIRDFLVFLPF